MTNQAKNPHFDDAIIPEKSRLIIGLSGGPDSVYLAHILADLAPKKSLQLTAAHLDHQWREDSAQDAQFCRMLCERLKINFISKTIEQLNVHFKHSGSQEELGRRYRRHFLESIAHEYGTDHIALAHHADDQMETFFLRLLRGSSLTGLTGMKSQDGLYIRPLLQTSKQAILEYLQAHEIPYLQDPSNSSDHFLRNRIRSTVIPALKSCDSRFTTTFWNTFERLQETEEFLAQETEKTLGTITTKTAQGLELDIEKFLALAPLMRYRVLLAWLCAEKVPFSPSQSFFDEMIRFLMDGKESKHQVHQRWAMGRKKGNACIEK